MGNGKKLNSTRDFESFFDELFPICRSITGNGYRESLNILGRIVPFEIKKFPSGTPVFDWIVPEEWNINDAYILTPDGRKIADFKRNNLHIVGYSEPIDRRVSFEELNQHLHSLPDEPDLVPYVTSYYQKTWGFCVSHQVRQSLSTQGLYRVFIDAEHKNGSVDIGLAHLPSTESATAPTVLITSYLCHPSLANNELSGPLILCSLFERLSRWTRRRLNYLFVINPETIGTICFLSDIEAIVKTPIHSGLVITCVGGPSPTLSYQLSRRENSPLDRLFSRASEEAADILIRKFDPSDASDERQYCSSEFNLPVGQIARSVYGKYREYHNSGDNKKFVRLDLFVQTAERIEKFLFINDSNRRLRRKQPYCEIQLGKRGLYPNLSSPLTLNDSSDQVRNDRNQLKAISYLLSYADGEHDLIDIAHKSGIPVDFLVNITDLLDSHDLLKG